MCEEADIYHVFHADPGFPRMSLREWLKDVRRAGSFAFWYHDDKLPALWGYLFKLVLSPIKQFALKLIGRK